MSNWDVFHGDTLELQRGLSIRDVQIALAGGNLRDDDLARPAGTNIAWLPISQIGELTAFIPSSIDPSVSKSPTKPTPPPARPEPTPEMLARTVPSPDWFELGADPDDVSFPVVPNPPDSGKKVTPPAAEPIGPSNGSEVFKLAPEEPRSQIPSSANWAWDDDDDEVVDADQLEVLDEEADGSKAPSDAFMSTPADPAEQWDLDRYDLNPEIGQGRRIADEEGPSSRIALPVVEEQSSLVALPVAAQRSSEIALPVVPSRDWSKLAIAAGEVDESEGDPFTFSRRSANTVEELDLAPMVDVAFQLVLFFMVTATTILYKTLEVPKPSGESPPAAVAQGRSKTVDDLRDDFIVVEIDPSGTFTLDREPVAGEIDTLIERLRSARDKTARLTMLLSADYATPHRYAVLAIDAANEIGLRIAVARPKGRQAQGQAPSLFPLNPPGQPKAKGG